MGISAFSGGIIAGIVGAIAIDIAMTIAYILWGIPPIRLSQWDASNVIGQAAFRGGFGTAALGFCFHCMVSVIWGMIAWIVLRANETARNHPIAFGVFFGLLVMGMMLWIVVPLGRAHTAPLTVRTFIPILIAHTVFFGVPVVLTARAISFSPGH